MKHLELLKFPTHKASFSFHFSSNFSSLNSLLSFPTLSCIRYCGNKDIIMWVKLGEIPTNTVWRQFYKMVSGGK